MHREIPDPSLFKHSHPVQIRFNDIDVLRHLNNTVYFSLYDTGKAYYFEAVKEGKVDWKRVDTIIANVNNTYIAPIYFGEQIEVRTRCRSRHDKSFVLEQMLVKTDTGEVKSFCETVMVSLNPETMQTTPLSKEWCDALDAYEGRELYEERKK